MIKISAVSYLNTLPFVYGIEHSGFLQDFSLDLDTPAHCAEKLKNGQVDIGLVPVAILPELNYYKIISSYCIGADGAVKTVVLYSDVPLEKITHIYLDYQSRTSVELVKVLAEDAWKISPEWLPSTPGFEEKIGGTIAGLVIGDRTFNLQNKFKYVFDLANEWKLFTGLPFVFACWVSNKELTSEFELNFDRALFFGLSHKDKALETKNFLKKDYDEYLHYLKNHISYTFEEQKKKALELFLFYSKSQKLLENSK